MPIQNNVIRFHILVFNFTTWLLGDLITSSHRGEICFSLLHFDTAGKDGPGIRLGNNHYTNSQRVTAIYLFSGHHSHIFIVQSIQRSINLF
jgi:hypothetical protein